MDQGWRFSVRLNPVRAACLRKLAAQDRCAPSDLLRRALDNYTTARTQGLPVTNRAEVNVATVGLRQLPIASEGIQEEASAAPSDPRLTAVVKAAIGTQASLVVGACSCLPGVPELESQYHAFGAQIWRERRMLFRRTVTAAKVAQANNENPRDAELYAELIRIGDVFGLLI
jgi:hypothetical protein